MSHQSWMALTGNVGERGYVDELAVVGRPPEHRLYRWKALEPGGFVGLMPLIASSAIVEALVTIDAGIDRPTRVGARTMLMKKAHVAHDVVLGDDCNVAPGAMIGGHVTIGDRVKIGLGASIRPRVTIGDDVVIGAGAVVVKDIPAGEKWAGNPARPLDDLIRSTSDRDLWEEWYQRTRYASLRAHGHNLNCGAFEARECNCGR